MDYLPGTVLRLLPNQLQGFPSACYVVLHVEGATAQLCLAGEDENGDVCTTEILLTTNIYNLSFFKILPVVVPMNIEPE